MPGDVFESVWFKGEKECPMVQSQTGPDFIFTLSLSKRQFASVSSHKLLVFRIVLCLVKVMLSSHIRERV